MAAFVWGDGGAQMTPEAIAAQRKVAQAMMQRGSDYSPVQSAWQGAARLSEGLLGGLDAGMADAAERKNTTAERELLASLISGGAPAVVPAPVVAPTGAPVVAAPVGTDQAAYPTPPAPGPAPTTFRPGITAPTGDAAAAIAAIESGGKYDKLGPVTRTGDRAYGKYQVMGANVPQWTRTHLGQEMTPDQFLASPEAQDAVFRGQFGQYAGKYGPEGAAKAWFAGEKGMNNPNAKDQLGTSVQAYADKFTRGYGAADPAALPPNAQPAQGYAIPGQSPAVAQVAQAMPSDVNRLLLARSNPNLSEGTKKVLDVLISQKTKGETTDEIKEYNLAKSQGFSGSFFDFKTGLKKAGATNVTTNVDKGEDSFAKAAGTAQAKRFDDLAADGQQATQMISDINTLTDLGKNIGTGKAAELKAMIGPYAESLGIKVEGLSDIQAYEAVVNRVAPTLRVKGSGAQSDLELKNFLKSLPSLGNTPEGNNIAATVLKGLQENKILAAEIGAKALNGEIKRPEAEKMLRELPDPMKQYRDYMKANRGAPTSTGASPKQPEAGWQDLGNGIRIREKK